MRLYLSATPFCWGVYLVEVSWRIPLAASQVDQPGPVYSLPPSLRIVSALLSRSVSQRLAMVMTASVARPLVMMGMVAFQWVWSSMMLTW